MIVAKQEATPTGQRTPPPGKMTFEEYLQWLDEDTWAEWVNGEVVMVSPASRYHQEIFGFLNQVLGLYVERHNLGKILSAPFVMKIGPDLPPASPISSSSAKNISTG